MVGEARPGDGEGEAGNAQIVMLGLRNRSRAPHGWNNETLKVEHSGIDGQVPVDAHVIDPRSLLPEERASLRAFLLEHQPAAEADDQAD